jgi:hypothetical protein
MSLIDQNPKTLESWYNQNIDYLSFYYQEYPFIIENGITLPIETEILSEYYLQDSENRNITPNPNILDNYSFLFSYYLENFPKSDKDKFKLNTGLGYLWNATKIEVSNIGNTISNVVGTGFDFLKSINKYLPLILGVAGLYFLTKLKK